MRKQSSETNNLGEELYGLLNCVHATLRVSVASAKRKASCRKGSPVPRIWFYRWKKRYGIVLRSTQRTTTRTSEDISKSLQSFHEFLYNIRLSRIVSIIINLDMIPFPFSGSMNSTSFFALSARGCRDIIVAEDPAWTKRCASYIAILVVIKRASWFEPLFLRCVVLLRRGHYPIRLGGKLLRMQAV